MSQQSAERFLDLRFVEEISIPVKAPSDCSVFLFFFFGPFFLVESTISGALEVDSSPQKPLLFEPDVVHFEATVLFPSSRFGL